MGLLAPGAVLAGYRIESVVGRGGMGVVYRARELELDRVVALKVIAPELVEDARIRDRFLKEARTAASIEHPNVIPVHAAAERDGVAYIAMRYVDGDDVRTLVRRDGPLAPGRAADIVAQAGVGLDAIHRAGFVHRDVKPANVLVDRDGHVYVTDFGLAKQVVSRSGATRTGQWVGTLDYVAPEQIRGGRIDARTDVYALGGVLVFTLTGRVPFEREGDEAKLWAQLSEPPPVPSRLRDGVPRELDAVVARAMNKAPDARYPSTGDVGRAARAAAAGGPVPQTERMVARGAAAPGGVVAEASTAAATRPVVATQAPPQPRRRRAAYLVAALAVPAAVAAVLVLMSRDNSDQAARGRSPAATPPSAATQRPPAASAPAVRVAQKIPRVGHRPNGIALANGDLWVTSYGLPWMTRLEAATGRERRQHPRVGAGVTDVISTGDSVWVAGKQPQRVLRINARSGHVTARLDPGAPPVALAVGLGSLWVATMATGADQLRRYDHAGNELARIPLPTAVTAVAIAAGAVFVAQYDPPEMLRIDPRTGKAERWATLLAPASSLSYSGGYLWAATSAADTVTRVGPLRRDGVTTALGHRPVQALVAGGQLFVSSNTDHTVWVVDPRTLAAEGKPLHVGLGPYALAAGDHNVWVTGTGDNTVTRIAYG